MFVDYLENGATITAKYYVALLDKLKQQLVSKRRGKLSKGILFLQDNAAPHKAITHQKLAEHHFGILKHLVYSSDFALSDYYLLPHLKKHLNGRKFSNIEEATLAADRWFAAQQKEFFLDGLKKFEQRSHKCVELRGEYVNTFFQFCSLFSLQMQRLISRYPQSHPEVLRGYIFINIIHTEKEYQMISYLFNY
jgi:hypothetical protein